MYRSAFVLLAVVATLVHGSVIKSRVPELDGRIVGGEDTTIDSYPYQVSIRLFGSHICGGSIVNNRVVITAAHCIYSFLGASAYSVQYGTTVVGGDNNVVLVERIIKNENYDSSVINNDVALIFLASDIPYSATAKPIQLASEEPAPGTPAVVSGWGTLTEGGSAASILQQVSVEIVARPECQEKYSDVNQITDKMVCAGVNGGGKDACQGDSGGPLVANGKLAGIVSWGVGCAQKNFPGVYSNVATLRNWIDANMA
ncbi:trypsin beta-like [Calliphora vicina]|uniref:trypsin beta-like n=1 Tax=Calliphora vicina TaxID=7373 RepID=UPI00325BEBE6